MNQLVDHLGLERLLAQEPPKNLVVGNSEASKEADIHKKSKDICHCSLQALAYRFLSWLAVEIKLEEQEMAEKKGAGYGYECLFVGQARGDTPRR